MITGSKIIKNLFVLFFVLFPKLPFADELILHPNREEYLLGPHLEILEDTSKSLTLQEIASGNYNTGFTLLNSNSASFNNSEVTFWLRFNIDNRTTIRNWIIEISTAYVGHYDLYFSEDNINFQEVKSGSLLPFGNRYYAYESMLHRLPLKEGKKYNVLIKISSTTPVYFDPKIITPRKFIEKATKLQYLLGLYYGIILVLFIYSLFNFLALKNRTYLWYGLYILFLGLMLLCIDGKIFRYFLQDYSVLNQRLINVFLTLAGFFGLFYIKSFLQTKALMPTYHRFVTAFQIILISSVIITPFLPEFYSYAISQITPIPALLVMLAGGFISLSRGNRSARLFLLGFGSFAVGAIITNLSYSMIIPNNDFTPYAIHCGSALEAIILVFGLSQQMSLFKKEKEKAQKETIEQLKENEQLATKVNRELEEKVTERTMEVQTQKKEIEQQKDEIEEKNKNITDSIFYAKRIQEAMLPTDKFLNSIFPEHFVLYKPKDIVSGDIYWAGKKENKKFLAAIDCTGHGVPGAFMSFIGNSLLDDIINKKSVTDPGEILNLMREGVIKTLNQTGVEGESRDGMDVALCIFDSEQLKLKYAGANNSIWVIRKNSGEKKANNISTEEFTLIEIKPNKFPIGIHIGEKTPFTTHEFDLKKGDAVYMFSDGYADQFGGPLGKKFKYKAMKNLLLSIQKENCSKQKEILVENFNTWKNTLEQVDDVLIIGVRVI